MTDICQRYAKDVLVGPLQVFEISFLTLMPMRLTLSFRSVGKAIRARLHDSRHALTEPVSDIFQSSLAALIFNAIVQKSRDSKVLVTAVL
jgi:hypothetical protein